LKNSLKENTKYIYIKTMGGYMSTPVTKTTVAPDQGDNEKKAVISESTQLESKHEEKIEETVNDGHPKEEEKDEQPDLTQETNQTDVTVFKEKENKIEIAPVEVLPSADVTMKNKKNKKNKNKS
jgi:hypothetical protein